jgi:hypothetical protein
MAARAFASGTGPRTTGREIVVASVMSPVLSSTDARAVGPSSHGLLNTRWSLVLRARKPRRVAVSA